MSKFKKTKVTKILNWLSTQKANTSAIGTDVIKSHVGKGLHVGACISADTWDKLERRLLDAMSSTTVRTPREGVPEPAVAQSDKKDAARYRRLIAILTGGYGLSVGKDASIRLDDAFEERITSDQITKAIDSDMGEGVPEKAKKKGAKKK